MKEDWKILNVKKLNIYLNRIKLYWWFLICFYRKFNFYYVYFIFYKNLKNNIKWYFFKLNLKKIFFIYFYNIFFYKKTIKITLKIMKKIIYFKIYIIIYLLPNRFNNNLKYIYIYDYTFSINNLTYFFKMLYFNPTISFKFRLVAYLSHQCYHKPIPRICLL